MKIKINNHKTWLPVFFLVPFLLFTSCNDDAFLQEDPMDFLAPENAYNTIPGIQQGITGLHYTVRRNWYSDGGGHQDGFAIMLGGVGTDVAFHGENPGGNRKLVNYQAEMTSDNWQFNLMWEDAYILISRANNLIYGIENSNATLWTGNEQKKDEYLAEAKFFRAWAYYFLTSLWGDVPLVLERVTTAKVDFVRDPVADIHTAMVTDLLYAAENLPLPSNMEAPGRINQKAAWHLLAQYYLSMNQYQNAVDAATEVIDNYGSALMTNRFGSTVDVFGSGDVFLDLHAYGNQNLAENTEAIWVIQNSPQVAGGYDFPGERGWGPAYFRMGNTPDGEKAFLGELYNGSYTGYLDIYGRPVAWIRPTDYMSYFVWQSDWDNDIRNAPHQIIREFYFQNPASTFDGQVIDFDLYDPSAGRDALKDTCQFIYPYFMKHSDPENHFTDPARSGGGRNNKDLYAMRLADTYLLRAEAYLGLGNPTLAAQDINEVRTRANATPVDPGSVDMDYLLDERARELYGEEFRHITLRRTGTFLERVRQYCNNPIYPACNVQDYNVLFPIPQSQIDLNIEATIEQNPGYPGS